MNAPVPSLPTPPVTETVPEPLNPFFRITIFAGGLFVVTILAMIASALGPTSSSIKTAFDENAGWLLAAEVIAILASAFFAMAGDQDNTPEQASDSTDENEPVHPEAD
ncbi:MAG: hypothetical protein CMJ69_00585 [Planctomycetaceae bacterium]|nr:hypothetical protein [Planctomycetaceae bacterium]|tara:strand:- start:7037 stop:7360 length:324 start_codon:yes stop_codon:yes gene_type:complete